ncbi:alkaline phosphatase family protein [Actinobaculum suis]|uniref:alkaline phosphatase family protein n=1 Tax=Actinobaculum suis TaxID=1657 RepID=UPI000A6853C3|nr:alkaline phosphatase family protein [Actinobaculum suis]
MNSFARNAASAAHVTPSQASRGSQPSQASQPSQLSQLSQASQPSQLSQASQPSQASQASQTVAAPGPQATPAQAMQVSSTSPAVRPRPLLLLGLDGTRWSIAAEPGVGTNLQRLAREGSWHQMTMEVPTISAPGWGSILTGTTHAEHGLRDNSCVGGRTWNCPDFLSQAFYEDQRTTTFAAAGWPVLVDPSGLGPIIHPRMEQQYAGLHNVIVRDGETYGYQRIDAEIADIAAAKLRSPEAFDVGFVYFCDVDDAGHVYGLQGEEYRAAIRRVDAHVGHLVEVISARDEDWLVVLTTDHGHRDEGGHGGDSPRERESWVVAWAPSGNIPNWPEIIEPWELAGLMLAARRA